MQITIQTINAAGLKEIAEFLRESSTISNPGADQIAAFARDAEFQLAEGNGASIELAARQSLTNRPVTFTVSDAGIDTLMQEIEA